MAGLEYSKNGLVGVLTPQANTTVEPEFRVLWPKNVGMINARMISNKTVSYTHLTLPTNREV